MEEEAKEEENWSHSWIYKFRMPAIFYAQSLNKCLICSFVDGEVEVQESKKLTHAHPGPQSRAGLFLRSPNSLCRTIAISHCAKNNFTCNCKY